MSDFIGKKISHTKHFLLLLLILLAILSAFIVIFSIVNLAPGKQISSESEFLSSFKSNSRVKIVCSKQNIQIVHDNVSKSGELLGVYSLIPFVNKYVLIYAPETFYDSNVSNSLWQFDGYISKCEYADRIATSKSGRVLDSKGKNVSENLLPYVLDCTSTSTQNTITIILAMILILAAFVFAIFRFKRSINPEKNPTVISLSKYGNFETVKNEINQEIEEETIFKGSTFVLTTCWIVFTTFCDWKAVGLEEIIWAYKQRIRGTTYGNNLVINCSDGKTYRISIFSQKKIDAILLHLKSNFPWIIAGYSNDCLLQWRSRRLIGIVNTRKRNYMANENQIGK